MLQLVQVVQSYVMLPEGFGPRATLHNLGQTFSVLTSAPVNIYILSSDQHVTSLWHQPLGNRWRS